MKKLKQAWVIVVMIKTFLPRVFKEFKDLTNLFAEIKEWWFERFPPKEEVEGYYYDPSRAKIKKAKVKKAVKPDGPPNTIFSEDGKIEYEEPESDVYDYTPVPEGRSYFKKKGEEK